MPTRQRDLAQAKVPTPKTGYHRQRFRPNTIPERGHRLVKLLYEEMNAQQCSQQMMADRSGISRNTFKDWRTRTDPTVTNLEACFNVLGLELTVREKK